MAVISFAEAKQWLDATKLGIAGLDTELEASAQSIALGKLQKAYDTSGWVSDTDTPRLVRKIVSLLYAGFEYNRTYSEEASNIEGYGNQLIRMAYGLIDGLIAGDIDLPDVSEPAAAAAGPEFYPTDASTLATQNTEWPEPLFTMGKVF